MIAVVWKQAYHIKAFHANSDIGQTFLFLTKSVMLSIQKASLSPMRVLFFACISRYLQMLRVHNKQDNITTILKIDINAFALYSYWCSNFRVVTTMLKIYINDLDFSNHMHPVILTLCAQKILKYKHA